MSKNKKPKQLPVSWIVAVRSNLDDVIIGAFPYFPQARSLARLALDDPEKAQAEAHPNDRWDDSGVIGVAIYRARGRKVEHYWQESPDGKAKAA